MPRRARIAFPELPHHIIHRGHRRNPVFFCDSDRVDYLGTLAECRARLGVEVYAYCLMDNHVHLVVNPRDDASRLSVLMQRLAGRHTRRLNAARGWTGSTWESRFKCSPIESERYLLTCGRYVDQNPVRARMVERPGDFAWSSFRARVGEMGCPFLDPDPAVLALSPRAERRVEMYRALADVPLPAADLELIRAASQRNQLTGDECFVASVASQKGVVVPLRARGRPKKRKAE
jgi:putative transposase